MSTVWKVVAEDISVVKASLERQGCVAKVETFKEAVEVTKTLPDVSFKVFDYNKNSIIPGFKERYQRWKDLSDEKLILEEVEKVLHLVN